MPEPMRSLTVQQPWAWALLHGGKVVENRRWTTEYRGPVAIHAGLTFDRHARRALPMREALAKADGTGVEHYLFTGRILGVVDLTDVHLVDEHRGCYREAWVLGWVPFDGSDAGAPGWQPRFCSPWGEVPDRPARGKERALRHLVMRNPRPLAHPLPFTGHQGLRRMHPDVERQVRLRLEVQP